MPTDRRRSVIILSLFACLVTGGCTAAPADHQSRETEEQFLQLLDQQWPAIASTHTEIWVNGISVAIPDTLYQSRYNLIPEGWLADPQQALRDIDAQNRSIAIQNHNSGQNRYPEFQIKLNAAMWTALIKQTWVSQITDMQQESRWLIEQQLAQAPANQEDELRYRLSASVMTAEHKLMQIADTLAADGTCTITTTRDSKPLSMVIESVVSYDESGSPRQETVRLNCLFENE